MLGMKLFGNSDGICSLIFVCWLVRFFSDGLCLVFSVLMVFFSNFIYSEKLMVFIELFCFLLSSLFALWIFRLCVVSVKFVLRFFSEVIVLRCFCVLVVIVFGCGVSNYVYVWWCECLMWLCNWCSCVRLKWFVCLMIIVLVVGMLILVLIMVV